MFTCNVVLPSFFTVFCFLPVFLVYEFIVFLPHYDAPLHFSVHTSVRSSLSSSKIRKICPSETLLITSFASNPSSASFFFLSFPSFPSFLIFLVNLSYLANCTPEVALTEIAKFKNKTAQNWKYFTTSIPSLFVVTNYEIHTQRTVNSISKETVFIQS